jgi:KUP system potassium uptake protein
LSTEKVNDTSTFSLTLAALGVVYGDIGTSPLYSMRESLGGIAINLIDILGILSLIFWSLIIIISFKYLIILFRADNDGEGGILALLALITRLRKKKPGVFFILGILGAGLLIGDGMLTPAISVISSVEGLRIISPSFSNWILPLTITIIILLYSAQSFGTEKIGFVFGPVLFLWFITIGILGFRQIVKNPVVLHAINPYHAVNFFLVHGWTAYILLGGVFLVVTGGEALYADLGHFGKNPIRYSWFFVALPGLLLNYFGQGAFLLNHPKAIANPFYLLAPTWFYFPLFIIATLATIIASQAVISATFSLTKQAVLLGLYPHLPIIQTSKKQSGQVYIPQMNLILAIGTVLLVLTFRNSNTLTHAYGIAVNLEMLLTSILIFYLAYTKWYWNKPALIILFTFLGSIDLAFLGANAPKVITGGWVPIVFALMCTFIMYTWNAGRQALQKSYYLQKDEFSKILRQLDYKSLHRLPDTTAIFITDIYDRSGGSLLHFLKLIRTLPEHILILNYIVENVPYVADEERFEVKCLKPQICELTLHYGFMDTVSVPKALVQANEKQVLPFKVNVDVATYLIEIPHVIASKVKRTMWFYWQEKLFAFLVRNYSTNLNIEFYQVPFNRTIALGTYYVI